MSERRELVDRDDYLSAMDQQQLLQSAWGNVRIAITSGPRRLAVGTVANNEKAPFSSHRPLAMFNSSTSRKIV